MDKIAIIVLVVSIIAVIGIIVGVVMYTRKHPSSPPLQQTTPIEKDIDYINNLN